MAIAYGGVGTAVTGSGASPVLAPVAPASTANSRNYLVVTWKDGTIAPPSIGSSSGTWIPATQVLQSGVATGLDVGSPNTLIYFADGTAPTSNTVTFSGTVGACQAVIVNVTKGSSEYFTHELATGTDGSNGANISIVTSSFATQTALSNLTLMCSGANTDGGTPSSVALTNHNTVTNRIDSASVTGDDSRLSIWTAAPTTIEDTARTFSYTNASSSSASLILINVSVSPIAFQNAGTAVAGNGTGITLSPVSPASSAGSTNFLVVSWKPTSSLEPTVTSTTGTWIRKQSSVNTTPVASGADVGAVKMVVYYANGAAPTGTSVKFDVTQGVVGAAQAVIVNVINNDTANFVIGIDSTSGEDDSHNNNFSAASITNFNATAENIILTFVGENSDAVSPTVQAYSSSGSVYGAVTSHLSSASSTGDDSYLAVVSATCNSGPQAGNITYSHTSATNQKGVVVFLKLSLIAIPLVTVTPLADFWFNPGYQISINDMAGYDNFNVTRVDEAGHLESDIRGGQYQSVTGATFAAEDYEFRFGGTGWSVVENEITWRFKFYSNQTLVHQTTVNRVGITDLITSIDAAATGLPDAAFPKTWLSVPEIPQFNIPVAVEQFNIYNFDAKILSESRVLGRSNPVINTDVLSGRRGKFTLLLTKETNNSNYQVPSEVDEYSIRFALGSVMMLRNAAPALVGIEDIYFIVKNVNVVRLNSVVSQVSIFDQARIDGSQSVDNSFFPVIRIDIEFIEVDAPPNGIAVSQFSWQSLLDNFASWQDVANFFGDWLDVLQNPSGV